MSAMHKHLFPEINGLVQPGEGLFHLFHVRRGLIRNGEIINLKARLSFYLMQIAKLAAQVYNGIDALPPYGIKFFV